MHNIARTMRERSMAKTFAETVKEMLGTAQSVVCTVEGKHPYDDIEMIDDREVDVPEE